MTKTAWVGDPKPLVGIQATDKLRAGNKGKVLYDNQPVLTILKKQLGTATPELRMQIEELVKKLEGVQMPAVKTAVDRLITERKKTAHTKEAVAAKRAAVKAATSNRKVAQTAANNTLDDLDARLEQLRNAQNFRLFSERHFAGHRDNKLYLPTEAIIGGPWDGQRRATGIQARLSKDNISGGQPATKNPPGWNIYANNQGDLALIARGHLLARELGGKNIYENLVVLSQTVNQRMYNQVESQIIGHVTQGEEVDYEVLPRYDTLKSAIPSGITMRAMSKTKDGTRWSLGPLTLDNPTNLQDVLLGK